VNIQINRHQIRSQQLFTVAETLTRDTIILVIQFRKFLHQHQCTFATRVRTWRIARLYSVLYSKIALSETVRNRIHVHMLLFA
jgi:hypothetical protein